jgi:hypothetical protein
MRASRCCRLPARSTASSTAREAVPAGANVPDGGSLPIQRHSVGRRRHPHCRRRPSDVRPPADDLTAAWTQAQAPCSTHRFTLHDGEGVRAPACSTPTLSARATAMNVYYDSIHITGTGQLALETAARAAARRPLFQGSMCGAATSG